MESLHLSGFEFNGMVLQGMTLQGLEGDSLSFDFVCLGELDLAVISETDKLVTLLLPILELSNFVRAFIVRVDRQDHPLNDMVLCWSLWSTSWSEWGLRGPGC